MDEDQAAGRRASRRFAGGEAGGAEVAGAPDPGRTARRKGIGDRPAMQAARSTGRNGLAFCPFSLYSCP
jgi:hypothetical protein